MATAGGDAARAVAGGNPPAFDDIVREHSRRIFNFLYQLTGHRQDAEDLTQQTFIKAFHNLHRFDVTRPMINWLLTIARRTALNHFRAAKRWEEMPADLAATGPSPARDAENQDHADTVWARARRVLSQREFEVMWLRFGEELSTAETARIVGITRPHVKILVYRARQQLLKAKDLL
jgi:RNA polymerase sigma-70 factor (ECF subfamily)